LSTDFYRLLLALLVVLALAASSPLAAQEGRKVIIDEDSAGPGGTGMQAILALVNSSETDVLGITVVTGDAWRDEEVAHALRLLEIIGRTDIPVVPGAVFPLVNSKEEVKSWEKRYGNVLYQGAWNSGRPIHGPWEIPPLPEGAPKAKAANEDAAHFLIRMIHRYPHQVTIYEGGPLTNLALALAIDPGLAPLAKELVLMGGSIHPATNDPELAATPHREFNFWMDPEASRRALRSAWRRIVATTVDVSVKTRMDETLIAAIAEGKTPAAQYVAKYSSADYLWDELAAIAWLDPSVITRTTRLYMDVSIEHDATYGDTLTWAPGNKPAVSGPLVEVEEDLDRAKFYKEFLDLMTRPTPRGHRSDGRATRAISD
jgi:inosine-uridine nucleoside N-ribohydrolase